jgi:hypothetical protein
MEAMATINHQDIALMAYQIYLAEGRPDGKETAHWDAAEERLTNKLAVVDEGQREEGEGGIISAPDAAQPVRPAIL